MRDLNRYSAKFERLNSRISDGRNDLVEMLNGTNFFKLAFIVRQREFWNHKCLDGVSVQMCFPHLGLIDIRVIADSGKVGCSYMVSCSDEHGYPVAMFGLSDSCAEALIDVGRAYQQLLSYDPEWFKTSVDDESERG